MSRLDTAVVLVTGASRGAGRGIALELGAAGATVYVTGRSVSGGPTTDNVPGTIDDCAQEVTARGGRGIAVRCDHTIDPEVDALFDRIRSDRDGSMSWSTMCGVATKTASVVRCHAYRSGSSRSRSGIACSPPACTRTLSQADWPCR